LDGLRYGGHQTIAAGQRIVGDDVKTAL